MDDPRDFLELVPSPATHGREAVHNEGGDELNEWVGRGS